MTKVEIFLTLELIKIIVFLYELLIIVILFIIEKSASNLLPIIQISIWQKYSVVVRVVRKRS